MTWHKLALYGFVLSIGTSIVNEVALKPFFDDPRPKESANKEQDKVTKQWKMKPGMPSGHVLNATTILTWALLEVAFRGSSWHHHYMRNFKWLTFIALLMA